MESKIGILIKERLEAHKMNVTEFSRAIGVERSNVYDIFKRETIDTGLLKKIGQVLGYDFFQDLLEEKTKAEIILRSVVSKKIYVEVNLTDEEINKIGLANKIIKQIGEK